MEATAEKVIKIISEPLAGHPLEVTASVVIAITEPDAQLKATELSGQADGARYAAKKAGRDRYCFAG